MLDMNVRELDGKLASEKIFIFVKRPVIAGNLGTARSTQFSVLGDTVNLAARLSGHAPAGEVWCNSATASALPEGLEAVPLEPIIVKGKQQPVTPPG